MAVFTSLAEQGLLQVTFDMGEARRRGHDGDVEYWGNEIANALISKDTQKIHAKNRPIAGEVDEGKPSNRAAIKHSCSSCQPNHEALNSIPPIKGRTVSQVLDEAIPDLAGIYQGDRLGVRTEEEDLKLIRMYLQIYKDVRPYVRTATQEQMDAIHAYMIEKGVRPYCESQEPNFEFEERVRSALHRENRSKLLERRWKPSPKKRTRQHGPINWHPITAQPNRQ